MTTSERIRGPGAKSLGQRLLATWVAVVLPVQFLPGQSFRLRLDSRMQVASYRGVELDSIPAALAVVVPGGNVESPDGFAVRCRPNGFCMFFRPGAVREGGPIVTSADFAVWRLGVEGLSIRGAVRLGFDVGANSGWPGTDPAVQVLETHLEYASPAVTGRLGRVALVSRFGFQALDGASVDLRPLGQGLTLSAYGGYGLARGVALPVTSPALNPLDDFQPRDRQLVAGGGVEWIANGIRTRAVYQREVDPAVDYFVTERVGLDAAAVLGSAVSVAGGADYDLAAGWWGSAEAALSVFAQRGSITAGARRYRPHFDLWTIWGAFSPIPYHAVFGAAQGRIVTGVDVRLRGEAYRFLDADAATPQVDVERDGWRWSLGATFGRLRDWSFDLDYHADYGPGAGSIGVEVGALWTPIQRLSVAAGAGVLERPLEFRFDDARVWSLGLRAELQPVERARFHLGARWQDEIRRRPDAAQFDWGQLRLDAGVSLVFGGGDPLAGLHPAIRGMPTSGGAR